MTPAKDDAPERDRDFQAPDDDCLPDLLDDWAIQGTHAQEYPYTAFIMECAAAALRAELSRREREPTQCEIEGRCVYDPCPRPLRAHCDSLEDAAAKLQAWREGNVMIDAGLNTGPPPDIAKIAADAAAERAVKPKYCDACWNPIECSNSGDCLKPILAAAERAVGAEDAELCKRLRELETWWRRDNDDSSGPCEQAAARIEALSGPCPHCGRQR